MYNLSNLYKRKLKIRKKIFNQGKYRLTVYKSNRHIYAQLFDQCGGNVLASSSSLDKDFKDKMNELNRKLSKIEQACIVGDLLAAKIKSKYNFNIAFDRSGFKFHGRIKAVADSVIKNGVIF